MPYVPQRALGIRMDPPWSPPMARSQAPAATRAAEPLDDPPVVRLGSWGLRTGPVAAVWLAAERHMSSHADLPVIRPPASRILVTTVASKSGTNGPITAEPLVIGTPATATLSLMAMVRPASGPSGAPAMSTRHAHAP